MKKILFVYLCVCMSVSVFATENPHGKLKFNCETCHTVESFKDMSFDHTLTGYDLQDRHQSADCKGCHDVSDFTKVKSNCLSCHNDIHQAKMGNDCQDCHTTRGWEQFDIEAMHLNTNFPLSGKHTLVDCQGCHTTMPSGDFSFNTTRCIKCHQSDYLGVNSPNHVSNGFSTDCESCHQMDLWRPAYFDNHDILFPIFSGEHKNEWDDCRSCHNNPTSYQEFSCLNCHAHPQTKTDADHNGIGGYAYNSPDCYFCHPQGNAGDFTNHDAQFFPIFSGAHASEWSDCNECHINPSDRKDFSCYQACHAQTETDDIHNGMTAYAYNSQDCYSCHPTGEKGQFTEHDPQFFPIYSGTHNNEWNNCVACHETPSNRLDFTCLTCHTPTETNASHSGIAGYNYSSTDCYLCHPTGEKGLFVDHDIAYFPIYSGVHNNEWNDCNICHNNPVNRSEVSCLTCHLQNETNDFHGNMTGYDYTSPSCLSCHPTGEKGQFIDHDPQFFPIYSGTHNNQWNDCTGCHTTVSDKSVFSCLTCHLQTESDANHAGITGYLYSSTDCYLCHPTGEKGQFVDHDAQFFPIFSGTHNNEWNDCNVCHTNPVDRTQVSCLSCHTQTDSDNMHGSMNGYSYDSPSCISCHPSGLKGTFRAHDSEFFPVFSGKHNGEWNDCVDCHTTQSTRLTFSCFLCHSKTKMDDKHLGKEDGYAYDSNLCYSCHPNGKS